MVEKFILLLSAWEEAGKDDHWDTPAAELWNAVVVANSLGMYLSPELNLIDLLNTVVVVPTVCIPSEMNFEQLPPTL